MTSSFNKTYAAVLKHHKKIKFIIIGSLCFLINSIILYGLTHLKVSVAISQVLGYECGLLFGYYANANWTYKQNKRGSTWSSLLKYHGASLSALLISTAIVVALNKELGWYPNVALVVASAVAMVWNFFLFDKFVFNRSIVRGTGDK